MQLDINFGNIFLIVIIVLFVFILLKGMQKVPEARARVIERFGKFNRVLGPGLHFVLPFIDRSKNNIRISTFLEVGGTDEYNKHSAPVSIVETKTGFLFGGTPQKDLNGGTDIIMSEQLMDPVETQMIAKDSAIIFPDVVLFFRIIDAKKAVYAVDDAGFALNKLLETTLRQEIGKLDSDAIISSRDLLSSKIKSALEEASIPWGVLVTRVEIQEIKFSTDIQNALSEARTKELIRRGEVVAAQQVRDTEILIAEGKKKATILEAEGKKEATILEAEGNRQNEILLAQGEFEKTKLQAAGNLLIAEARAKGFATINEALSNRSESVIALEALTAQVKISENLANSNGATMIIPTDTAGFVGALGVMQNGLNFAKQSIDANAK